MRHPLGLALLLLVMAAAHRARVGRAGQRGARQPDAGLREREREPDRGRRRDLRMGDHDEPLRVLRRVLHWPLGCDWPLGPPDRQPRPRHGLPRPSPPHGHAADSGDVPSTTPPLGGALKVAPAETFVGATALTGLIPAGIALHDLYQQRHDVPGLRHDDQIPRVHHQESRRRGRLRDRADDDGLLGAGGRELAGPSAEQLDGAMAGTIASRCRRASISSRSPPTGRSPSWSRQTMAPAAAARAWRVLHLGRAADRDVGCGGRDRSSFGHAQGHGVGPARPRTRRGFEWDRTTAYTNVLCGGPIAADDATPRSPSGSPACCRTPCTRTARHRPGRAGRASAPT